MRKAQGGGEGTEVAPGVNLVEHSDLEDGANIIE